METSTTIVNINPENLDKIVEFVGGVVGKPLAKPSSVAEFGALLCEHCDALVAGAEEESDIEGCFEVRVCAGYRPCWSGAFLSAPLVGWGGGPGGVGCRRGNLPRAGGGR